MKICSHAIQCTTVCISVGDDNAGHFFVGTQDKQLRIGISKVPAGASLFVSVNGLHLEQPSAKQEEVINQVSHCSCSCWFRGLVCCARLQVCHKHAWDMYAQALLLGQHMLHKVYSTIRLTHNNVAGCRAAAGSASI